MQGGVYQTGTSFGMNSYYKPPQIVGTISCCSTRSNGIISPTDYCNTNTCTSVVSGIVTKNSSFEKQVNVISALKHIDYDQNPKPVSIQLYEAGSSSGKSLSNNKSSEYSLFMTNFSVPTINQQNSEYSLFMTNFSVPTINQQNFIKNGSIITGVIGDMYSANSNTFYISNYNSFYTLSSSVLSTPIAPNQTGQFTIYFNDQITPNPYSQTYVYTFDIKDQNNVKKGTLNINISFYIARFPFISTLMPTTQNMYQLAISCDIPSFRFQMNDANNFKFLYSETLYSVPDINNNVKLVSYDNNTKKSLMYTVQTVTLNTYGSGSYTYLWVTSQNNDPLSTTIPIFDNITVSTPTITTDEYKQVMSVTFALKDKNITTNFVTYLICTIIDNNTNMVYNAPIVLSWGPLATSDINTNTASINTGNTNTSTKTQIENILIKVGAVTTGSASITGIAVIYFQRLAISNAMESYQIILSMLRSGSTIDALGIRGMTIATDGEVTEVILADTTEVEAVGFFEEALIFLSNL